MSTFLLNGNKVIYNDGINDRSLSKELNLLPDPENYDYIIIALSSSFADKKNALRVNWRNVSNMGVTEDTTRNEFINDLNALFSPTSGSLQAIDETTGLPEDVTSEKGRLNVNTSVTPIPDIFKFGLNPDIDSGSEPEDIWDVGGIYQFDNTPQAYFISSSNAGDTDITVIATVLTQRADEKWIEEDIFVTLNGQTKTQLIPDSGDGIIRCYRSLVYDATEPAGDVYIYRDTAITSGVPNDITKIAAMIRQGENQTLMAVYTVPDVLKNGKEVDFAGISWIAANVLRATSSGTKEADLRLRVRNHLKVFRTFGTIGINNTGSGLARIDLDPRTSGGLFPKDDVKVTCILVSTNNTQVAAQFQVLYEYKTE